MIEALLELGNKILESQSKKDSMIQQIETHTRKDEQKYLMKFDFCLSEQTLKFDILKELSEDTANEYLYFGRDGGPNAAQWYATTVNMGYLLAEVVDQLEGKLQEGPLKEQLKAIKDIYYMDLGENLPVKNRYMLNLHDFCGCLPEKVEEMLQSIIESGEAKPYKKLNTEVDKILKQWIQDNQNIKKDTLGLFTLCIDGIPISKHPDYIDLIDRYFEGTAASDGKKSKKKENLQCSFCGTQDALTYLTDKIDFDIKYFTTNQLIFSNNMDRKNYGKNMVLCQKCYDAVRAAENYMTSHLNTRLAGFDVYILPQIIWGELDKEDMDDLSEQLYKTFNEAKNIKNYHIAEQNLKEELDEKDYAYSMHLLFYKKANQSTKILKFIKNIHTDTFKAMEKAFYDAEVWLEKYYGDFTHAKIGLEQIYYHTPIKIKDAKPVNYRHVLDLYEAFFTGQKVKKNQIIEDLMACTRIKWFEQEGYNVTPKEKGNNVRYLAADMVRALYYIQFLKNYEMIEGGDGMDVSILTLNDNLKDYIKDMRYTEEQTSLFLLGHLIGNIGWEQSKIAGDTNYKPILNKINYNGMDKNKILRLSESVFEKLRQLKILKYNQGIYSEYIKLFDQHREHWSLNKTENLHYLLSGYSYRAPQKITEEPKENENNE